MATRYVDPAAGGANNGTSWTDAYTSLATAFTNAVAGDIVYCRGTETRNAAAGALAPSASGTYNARIQYIGCNAAGTARAGQFTVKSYANGDAPADLYKTTSARNYLTFENFTFDGGSKWSTNSFNSTVYNYYEYFKNCIFKNLTNGFSPGSFSRSTWVQCVFDSNTSGLNDCDQVNMFLFCKFIHNSGAGATTVRNYCSFFNCLFHGNGAGGINFYQNGVGNLVTNCTFDGNTGSGIYLSSQLNSVIYGNRFTNNTRYGIESTYDEYGTVEDYNHFYNNTLGLKNKTNTGATNDVTGTGSDGYQDKTVHNFSLKSDAQSRRIPLNIDWA
jgi:parallel beta-helix repeat protein